MFKRNYFVSYLMINEEGNKEQVYGSCRIERKGSIKDLEGVRYDLSKVLAKDYPKYFGWKVNILCLSRI